MITRSLIATLLIAIPGMGKEPKRPTPPTILGPGVYSIDELPENTHGAWLGLVQGSDGRWSLKKVTVAVRRTELKGDDPGRPTGYSVAPIGNEHVMLLMRGIPVKAGKKQIRVAKDYRSLAKTPGEQSIVGSMDNTDFRAWGEPIPGSNKVAVKLSWNDRLQELYTLTDDEQNSWDILWAGDLDGDGAPDFILAIAEGSLGEQRLLLSSQAGPDELVGLAGGHKYGFGD